MRSGKSWTLLLVATLAMVTVGLSVAQPNWNGTAMTPAPSMKDESTPTGMRAPSGMMNEPMPQQTARPTGSTGYRNGNVDQFARPVEEEITEEVIAMTDLSEEGSVIGRIFSNQAQIERLLGTDVTFIYNSDGRRDPMIIPWIRREFDMQVLLDVAVAAERAGQYQVALEAYYTIVNEYSGSRAAGDAALGIQRIEGLVQVAADGTPGEQQIILPREIAQGLTGILYEDSAPNCLIGDSIFGVGETIPNFEVTILEINNDNVVFLYRDHTFTVPVVAN